ncbi:universal stress protein [Streptomyces coeruleoprunus]|uniref:Universal stress protein n=1 Tax=Streptomyces coeruleoprunus TaxID=285563 RepID=A0ABV9X913_9ACTN
MDGPATDTRDELVVGVDPRDASRPALDWAADEALRRNLALRLVLAVVPGRDPRHGARRPDDTLHRAALRKEGTEALADAAAWIADTHGGLAATPEIADGVPAAVLCARSGRARMLVLGSRHLGRTAEFFSTGSVAVPVSARAECPVVVVAEPERIPRGPAHLVVGIDGSEACRAALAFALEEASLRGVALRAVWVWPEPPVPVADTLGALAGDPESEESAASRERHRLLSAAVAEPARAHPDVEVGEQVLRGHPVEELALASHDAVAVVVGRRGHGGYTGMRLGSVVHGLLHRAECPVITVPSQ